VDDLAGIGLVDRGLRTRPGKRRLLSTWIEVCPVTMIAGCVTWETLSLLADDAGSWLPRMSDLIIVALAAAAAVPLSLLVLSIRARRAINGEPRRSRRRRPRPRLNRHHPVALWLAALAVIVEMEADEPGHQAWMQRHGWVSPAFIALRLAEVGTVFVWARYARRIAARARAIRAGEFG
jgi:hypothetical protein